MQWAGSRSEIGAVSFASGLFVPFEEVQPRWWASVYSKARRSKQDSKENPPLHSPWSHCFASSVWGPAEGCALAAGAAAHRSPPAAVFSLVLGGPLSPARFGGWKRSGWVLAYKAMQCHGTGVGVPWQQGGLLEASHVARVAPSSHSLLAASSFPGAFWKLKNPTSCWLQAQVAFLLVGVFKPV